MEKKHSKRAEVEDHGETIANMNVDGLPWYQSEKSMAKKSKLVSLNLSKQERRAMIWGAYKAYLPVFLVILGSFALVYILFYLLVTLR